MSDNNPTKTVLEYNQRIKNSLKNGESFTKHLDTLLSTDDKQELLTSAQKLFNFNLNTDYLIFPKQYSRNDYYAIFMIRLLELSSQNELILKEIDNHLEIGIKHIKTEISLYFEVQDDGTADLLEIDSNRKLFSLNFDKRKLLFDNTTLIDVFLDQLVNEQVSDKLKFMSSLIIFAKSMEKDYQFKVDYSILETSNEYEYSTNDYSDSKSIVDKLFVASADSNYMLETLNNKLGAKINLDGGLYLNIYNQKVDDKNNWEIKIQDENENISLLKVLIAYPFISKWYLENREILESVEEN